MDDGNSVQYPSSILHHHPLIHLLILCLYLPSSPSIIHLLPSRSFHHSIIHPLHSSIFCFTLEGHKQHNTTQHATKEHNKVRAHMPHIWGDGSNSYFISLSRCCISVMRVGGTGKHLQLYPHSIASRIACHRLIHLSISLPIFPFHIHFVSFHGNFWISYPPYHSYLYPSVDRFLYLRLILSFDVDKFSYMYKLHVVIS